MLYGRAVFQCQLIGDNFKESVTRKWDLDNTLLLYNGYSINDSKYTEELYSSGFRLIVHNFTEHDLEKTYTCVYEFLQNSTKLSLSDGLFILLPRKVDKDITVWKNKMDIYVRFHDVFPEPKCTCTLNDESIKKPFDRNITMVGALFMASFRISLNLSSSSCANRINVKCSILEEIVLDEEALDKCTDVSMLPVKIQTFLVITVVLPFDIICMALLMLLVILVKYSKIFRRCIP